MRPAGRSSRDPSTDVWGPRLGRTIGRPRTSARAQAGRPGKPWAMGPRRLFPADPCTEVPRRWSCRSLDRQSNVGPDARLEFVDSLLYRALLLQFALPRAPNTSLATAPALALQFPPRVSRSIQPFRRPPGSRSWRRHGSKVPALRPFGPREELTRIHLDREVVELASEKSVTIKDLENTLLSTRSKVRLLPLFGISTVTIAWHYKQQKIQTVKG